MTKPTRFGRMTRRIAVTGVLAVAMLGLSGPAASAGDPEKIVTDGGEIYFFDRDNAIGAFDTKRDGYGVRAWLRWGGSHDEKVTNSRGAFSKGKIRYLLIHEKTVVWLQMCYTKKGRDVKCSQPQRARA